MFPRLHDSPADEDHGKAEQGRAGFEMQGDQGDASKGDGRAEQLHPAGSIPRKTTASPMVKMLCSWITSDERPAGMPRCMPTKSRVNCRTNWKRTKAASKRHGILGLGRKNTSGRAARREAQHRQQDGGNPCQAPLDDDVVEAPDHHRGQGEQEWGKVMPGGPRGASSTAGMGLVFTFSWNTSGRA